MQGVGMKLHTNTLQKVNFHWGQMPECIYYEGHVTAVHNSKFLTSAGACMKSPLQDIS